ncbi:MAG: hypothetical protein ABT16_01900 [Rhodanobacter sp. SCN 65-17]|nr:MAG: hypothetical protein ABT16_01900 [Rhodanobacter sp. SCN 65-17]
MLLKLEGGAPLYLQVYRALWRAIEDGRFPASSRLPGTRTLARQLGVSRTVVLQAFEQLESEGVVAGNRGSGTYVRGRAKASSLPALRSTGEFDHGATGAQLRGNLPGPSPWGLRARDVVPTPSPFSEGEFDNVVDLADPHDFQDAQGTRRWRQTLLESLDERGDAPRDARGLPELRRALALELHQSRGMRVDPDDILIVAGIQQARDLTARVLVQPGMSIAIEEPCDPSVRTTFAAAGARLVPCPVGDNGFDIERCADDLAEASLIYVMPSQQFPTGVVMGERQRANLLNWAYLRGAYVIEDDFEPDHQLVSMAAPPLLAVDQREQVIYIGAFAREFFPALHMAYVVVPRELRPFFAAAKWIADSGARFLMQRVLARYLSTGDYQRNLRRLSVLLEGSRKKLLDSLRRYFGDCAVAEGVTVGGTLLIHFLDLPRALTESFILHARNHGVRIASAHTYYANPVKHVTLLVRYAHVPSEHLDGALCRLGQAYREIAPPLALRAIGH